jgi:hypothetical protein
MKKRLWKGHFTEHGVPSWPCPRCNGTLKTKKDSVQQASSTYAKYVEDQFEIPERFVMFMQCTSPACGEIVAVMGDVATIPEQDADDHSELVEYFAPSFMDPPPPIIAMPKRVPEPVIEEIKLAFQLYWVDYRVCAARLRTSLERLMDHFGVAKTRIQKDSPNKSGRRRPVDLAARIDKLPKKIGSQDFSKILHALRVIGNLGTHGSKVTQAAMLDSFQLYEMALEKLFEDKNETVEAIIKRLKVHK